jgi:hypothetical protein
MRVLGADNSLCPGDNCPSKEGCLRYTQKTVSPNRQCSSEPLYDHKEKTCELFIWNNKLWFEPTEEDLKKMCEEANKYQRLVVKIFNKLREDEIDNYKRSEDENN